MFCPRESVCTGQCCGTIFGTPYCCAPSYSMTCARQTNSYVCAGASPGTSGQGISFGAIIGIVIGAAIIVTFCVVAARRRRDAMFAASVSYAHMPPPMVAAAPGYPGSYAAPAYGQPVVYGQPAVVYAQPPAYGYGYGYDNSAANFASGVIVGEALAGGYENHHHHHHHNSDYGGGGGNYFAADSSSSTYAADTS